MLLKLDIKFNRERIYILNIKLKSKKIFILVIIFNNERIFKFEMKFNNERIFKFDMKLLINNNQTWHQIDRVGIINYCPSFNYHIPS